MPLAVQGQVFEGVTVYGDTGEVIFHFDRKTSAAVKTAVDTVIAAHVPA